MPQLALRTENHEDLVELLVMKITVQRQTALSSVLEILASHLTTDLAILETATEQTATALEFWYPDDVTIKQTAADLRMIAFVLADDSRVLASAGIQQAIVQDAVYMWLFSEDNLLTEGEPVSDEMPHSRGNSRSDGLSL